MIADVTYSTSLLFSAPDFCGYEMRHVPALHINFYKPFVLFTNCPCFLWNDMVYFNRKQITTEETFMRTRVLTQTSKGKLLTIADEVTRLIEADKPTDVIMPAYPCDGERLIVIVASAKATMPDSFCRFMRSLKKSVTANIAFIIDGTPENAAKIVDMAKTNDSNVMEDNILYIQGGLPFKFAKKVTPDEMNRVKTWVDSVRAAMV